MPPCCESILGLNVEAEQGKQIPLEWTKTSSRLLEWWHDDGVPLAFPVESASSEVRREYREFFPEQAAKGSLISIYQAETGLLWMWPGPRASSRVETGMSGNFLSCSKGVKDPLDAPVVRCD